MFKVSNGVFIVSPEHVSHLFLVFLSLTLNKQMLSGSVFLILIGFTVRFIKKIYFDLQFIFPHTLFFW